MQALCWPVARLAGLACVVASGSESVLLIYEGTCPAWLTPWLLKLLKRVRLVGPGEIPVTVGRLSIAARARLSGAGDLRAEFAPGAFDRFRGLTLREAEDFALLKERATGMAARS